MTQGEALDILKTGANVFLTGEPGAGKTYVLNQYIEWLEDCDISVAVTASTGIAATHIGGMTIHAWSGIGARDALSPYELDQIAGKEKIAKRIGKARVLVIDEISMLDASVLEIVETICRTVRRNSEPFGGPQVIFVGDFFQLPPIVRRGDVPRFAFESRAWDALRLLTCYITEQYRQEDELLLGLLNAVRRNEVSEEHYTLLSEQKDIAYENIEPTKLYTHNKSVDEMNLTQLRTLDTEGRTYAMEARGNKQLLQGLIKSCLSPEVLEVKREAMVMCTKNNFETGYVNGTLGRVVDFNTEDGYPIIETSEGKQIKIAPQQWTIEEDGKVLAEITQVPLRLAWAITIHKSQGMSLDAAEIDLRSAFVYGQGYVALSRVRTLAGMKILGMNANSLLIDPHVAMRDERFRAESQEAERAFAEIEKEEIMNMWQHFVKAMGGKLSDGTAKKKKDRTERLRKESTYEATKELLLKGFSAREIARERKMALSTIWGHIEKLSETGKLSESELSPLMPHAGWEEVYTDLKNAFRECGTKKLKPVYEVLGEKYDYDTIRFGRILYTLK